MANGVAVVFDVRVSGHAHNAADHPFAQMRAGNTDDGEVPALVSDDDDDTTTSSSSPSATNTAAKPAYSASVKPAASKQTDE